ncbi:MAG TPA: dephospho-CoA kinase [Gammaproteobacteria bacterium]|nr:dephospho-CoA kinase [Gammaproteobacteria bacterium]
MLKVGLTGGIASGKSTVAAEFAILGVPIVDADVLARELTSQGNPGLTQLVAELGEQILDSQGRLDRTRLRRRLFADAALRARVEAILHPLVVRRLKDSLAAFKAPYAVAVIPLLVENPQARALVDRVLVLDCPVSSQLARLMSRDGESAESAQAMLSAQADRQRRLAAGDDILTNNGGAAELSDCVHKLHGLYLDIAKHPTQPHPGVRLP